MKNLIFASILFLAACSTPNVPIRSVEYQAPRVPESFFVCERPEVQEGRLTDIQVATLLLTYEENISNCRSNMNAIRTFLTEQNNRENR